MPRVPLMRWVAGASMVATVVGSAGCAGISEPTLDTREIVVYFDDAEVSPEALRAELLAEFGIARVKRVVDRKLVTGSRTRLSAIVAEMESNKRCMTNAEWKAWKLEVERNSGVTGVERHQKRALVGAPRGTEWPSSTAVLADIASQEAMSDVNASAAASNATGAGVTVAVLDGGFDTNHEAVMNSMGAGYDAIDDDTNVNDLGNGVDDDNDGNVDLGVGHGTFASSLILAAAPDTTIMPIRVLDDEAQGTNLALWLGISEAVDAGVDVISMSLVSPSMPQGLQDAIDDAIAADITLVISAGNDPDGPLNHTTMCANAIVVGGVDDNGAILSWSPNSTNVDIFAPAEGILGAIGGSGAAANSYATWDGTSFAAAFVSAAAALAKEVDPTLTAAQMETHLKASVTAITGSSKGIVDLDDASDD